MEAISFKVTSRGVIINLNAEYKFKRIKEALIAHSNNASNFFAGVDLYINLNGMVFTISEMQELIDLLAGYKEVENIYFLNKKAGDKSGKMDTIRINRTIRSGQCIKYPNNIVIIGDVNPGAEVIAGGDVLVVGRLRGVVHAGASGSKKSQVIALNLQPTQLRIGNLITRAPDGESRPEPSGPERAYIKDGVIIVEELKVNA